MTGFHRRRYYIKYYSWGTGPDDWYRVERECKEYNRAKSRRRAIRASGGQS